MLVLIFLILISYLAGGLPVVEFVDKLFKSSSQLSDQHSDHQSDQGEKKRLKTILVSTWYFMLAMVLVLLASVTAFLTETSQVWFIYSFFLSAAALVGARFSVLRHFGGHWSLAIFFGACLVMLPLPFMLSMIVFVVTALVSRIAWLSLLCASFVLTPLYLAIGRGDLQAPFPQGPSDMAAFLFCTALFASCAGISFKKVDILRLGGTDNIERNELLPKIIEIFVSDYDFGH